MSCCQGFSRTATEILRFAVVCKPTFRPAAACRSSQLTAYRNFASCANPSKLTQLSCHNCALRGQVRTDVGGRKASNFFCMPWLLGRFMQVRSYRFYQRKFNADANAQRTNGNSVAGNHQTASVSKQSDTVTSLWQKVKQKTKEYGKTFLVIHFGTYAVWLGSFYYLSLTGVDVHKLLEKVHTSEATMQRIENSRFSHAAIAFLLAKIVLPVRYLVSIALTELTVRALRTRGYLPAVTDQDKLRNLVKDEVNSRVAHIRRNRALRKQLRARNLAKQDVHLTGHTNVNVHTNVGMLGKRTLKTIAGRYRPARLARLLRRMPK